MRIPNISVDDAKYRLPIPVLWRRFDLHGDPAKSCNCPFHEDRSKSFSVFDDGQRWKCFAGCGGGDAIAFFQRWSRLPQKESFIKFMELARGNSAPAPRPVHREMKAKPKPRFPEFSKGSSSDLDQLACQRRIPREGLEWAGERGLLWFATLRGWPAWIISDSARINAQARRMDGQLWQLRNGSPKAYTLPGSSASWPIGIREAQPFASIALCEGSPDFLAAHYLVLWEQANSHEKTGVRCAPVAMLGAGQQIHADALPLFAGKVVRIFGHDDDPGKQAVRNWARQLKTIGVRVDGFRFSDLRQGDGQRVKDLNDSLLMDAASITAAGRMLP